MAVQGGLLATTIAQRHEDKLKGEMHAGNAQPILIFLFAKIVAYTILGFFLGWVGSFFQLSLLTRVILQSIVSIFMIGTALHLLGIHPIFRYFVIQPPRILTRLVRKQSKSNDWFAPFFLGLFTIFIPCGTTQAVMALAIASGTPLTGALMLFAFTLGTSPLFFALGYFATKLGDVFQKGFTKLASYAILALAIWSLNSSIALAGSPITLESVWINVYCTFSWCGQVQDTIPADQATTTPTIYIDATGYSPNRLAIKAGEHIELHLKNTAGQGCQQAFTLPALGIQKVVPVGQEAVVTFTAPKTPQRLTFSCSMNMYRGTIDVI